jgi:small subunit ribosomal protein S17e
MGRIKTMLIKRTTLELMDKHGDEFTKSFDDNKQILGGKAKITSKKMRNIIAGYATRLKKNQR